jgi:hypothetical protein
MAASLSFALRLLQRIAASAAFAVTLRVGPIAWESGFLTIHIPFLLNDG